MKNLAGQAAAIFLSRGATRGIQVISFLLLARSLSPEGFGAYGLITATLFVVVQLGDCGLRQNLAVQVGREAVDLSRTLGLLLWAWIASTLLCACAVFFIIWPQASLLNSSAAVAIVVAVAGVVWCNFAQGLFLGQGDLRKFALADVAPRILTTLFVVLLAVTAALTLVTALWAYAIGLIGIALVTQAIIFGRLKPARPRREDFPLLWTGLGYAASAFLITLQTRVGLAFLAGRADASEIGYFVAAQRGSEIFLEAASAVGLVLFSDTARRGAGASVRDGLRTAVIMFGAFGVGGVLVAIAAAFVLVPILGQAYAPAVLPLQLIAIGLAPAASTRVLNQLVAGAGRPHVSACIVAVVVLTNVLLCLALVPRWGATGAAAALVSAQYAGAIGYIVAIRLLKLNEVAGQETARAR